MKTFSFRPAFELRGRRFKGLRGFAGKPFHPPLTDVVVGAYTIGPVLSILGYLIDGETGADLWRAAGIVIGMGAAVSLAAAATGLADWLTTTKGTQMRRMANAHMAVMLTLTAIVVVALLLRFVVNDASEPSVLVLALDVVIIALVTIGGTIGGSLTYDFGFNVETATDNPVYHVSEHDIVHPHDEPPAS